MKKKKNIIIIIAIILLVSFILIYQNTREYTYVCFTNYMADGDIIRENYLDECKTNKRLPKGVITNKEDLILEGFSWYKILKSYNKGEMIYQDDIEMHIEPKSQETIIELLTEVEVMNHGNSPEEFTKYKAYVKNNKLYAVNLKTNEERVVFDKEKVDKIAIRPFCCAGEAWLLILTTNGNVYMSDKDCHYGFGFDFPFTKLNVKDIKSFKLIPAYDYDPVKNLYGINTLGEEILLQKLN